MAFFGDARPPKMAAGGSLVALFFSVFFLQVLSNSSSSRLSLIPLLCSTCGTALAIYFTFHFHGIWFLILFESTFDSHHSLMLHSSSSDGAIRSGYLLGGSFGCLNLVFAATFSPLYFENEFARILTGKEEAISMGILQPLALVWLMTIIS
jgi:hypothetical protein